MNIKITNINVHVQLNRHSIEEKFNLPQAPVSNFFIMKASTLSQFEIAKALDFEALPSTRTITLKIAVSVSFVIWDL